MRLTLITFNVTPHLNVWDPEWHANVGHRLLNNLESLQDQFSRTQRHQRGRLSWKCRKSGQLGWDLTTKGLESQGSRLDEADTGCPVTWQENLSRGQSRGRNQAWAGLVGPWCGKRPEAGSSVKPFQVPAGTEPRGPRKQTACEVPRRDQREKPTLMCEIRNQDTPVITSQGDGVRSGRPSKPVNRSWSRDVGLRWETAVVFRQVWFYGPVEGHWRHWICASELNDGQGWELRQKRSAEGWERAHHVLW